MTVGTKEVGKVFTEAELEAIAKENLNEDPKRRQADILAIKEWMSKQPHLKENGRNGTFSKSRYSIEGLIIKSTFR